MTIPEILNALEGLRDLTNDGGKAIIDSVKPAIRRLSDPDEVHAGGDVQFPVVYREEEIKEEAPAKTTKKKK